MGTDQQRVTDADWIAAAELPLDGDPETEAEVDEEQEAAGDDLSEVMGDPEPSEDEAEASEGEVDEAEDDADEPADFEWDGNADNLPPSVEIEGVRYDLRTTHKQMLAGYQRKMQEIAARDRERDAEIERLRDEHRRLTEFREAYVAGSEDPMPQEPSGEDPAEWRDYHLKLARWAARDEQRQQRMAGLGAAQEQRQGAQDQGQAGKYGTQEEVANRLSLLQRQEGWDDSYSEEMAKLMASDPTVDDAMRTDGGALAVFRALKTQREAAELKKVASEKGKQSVRRKARAGANTVSRSTSAKGSAAKKYAESWDDVIASVQREVGGG